MSEIGYLFVIVLCYLHTVNTSHFMGGFISWKPLQNNQIQILYRVAYHYDTCRNIQPSEHRRIPSEGQLECLGGCNPSILISPMSYYCTQFSEKEYLSTGSNVILFEYELPASGNVTYSFRYNGGNWVDLITSGSSWNLLTTAKLHLRDDTGRINSPPTTGMQPFVRLITNCPSVIKIPVIDSDGDTIRCRWADSDECASVCNGLAGSYLNQSSCNLGYTPTGSIGMYAVALQIEDFRRVSDRIPLSSISLQFIVNVVSGSCSPGPELLRTLTSNQKLFIDVMVEEMFNITQIARARPGSSISSIEMVGPFNATKSNLIEKLDSENEWQVFASWTPTIDDLGNNLMCFTAFDNLGYSSDQICYTINVASTFSTLTETTNIAVQTTISEKNPTVDATTTAYESTSDETPTTLDKTTTTLDETTSDKTIADETTKVKTTITSDETTTVRSTFISDETSTRLDKTTTTLDETTSDKSIADETTTVRSTFISDETTDDEITADETTTIETSWTSTKQNEFTSTASSEDHSTNKQLITRWNFRSMPTTLGERTSLLTTKQKEVMIELSRSFQMIDSSRWP